MQRTVAKVKNLYSYSANRRYGAMVTRHEIDRQLRAIGADFRFWGRAEVKELEHIIVPGERIMYCINGRYENGFATLCVTDQRVILIDKKLLYLTLEDIRYDMISELDFSHQLLDASLTIYTVNKTLRFTTLKAGLLRKATAYTQGRVIELRMQPAPATTSMQRLLHEPPQVTPIEHRVTNPYTKVPLIMRRRVSRHNIH